MEIEDSVYIIESLDQLRALADPLRTRILEELVRHPRTTSQLAEQVGETNNKMHYHVHELERFGLIKLVEKREKGGVLEKYYRAVARNFTLAPALLQTSASSEVINVVRTHFDHIIQGIAASFERLDPNLNPQETLTLDSETLWMTVDEHQAFVRQFHDLIAPYLKPRHMEKERAWQLSFVFHTGPQEKEDQTSAD